MIFKTTNGLLLSTNLKKRESFWRDDPCYKFIYSLKGSMRYQSRRNELYVSENEHMLFNPHDEHKQIAVDNHKFLIELDASFMNEAATSISRMKGDFTFAQYTQKNPLLAQWVQFVHHFMQSEEQSETAHSDVFMEHSFAQLSLLLVKSTIGTHSKDIITQPFQSVQPAIVEVMNKVKNDYQHSWSLEEMAAILHINKFQFAHLFKEVVGVSPYSWLQLFRISRSQELLLHTRRTITDIANTCGFSSVSAYNQLFKRLYGLSPSLFRKAYSNQVEK